MRLYDVSTDVNSVRNNTPNLTTPISG
ncbi:MAG: putative SOS response-associated peptidase YedK [Gammaproteobacteria bacterium]